VDAPVLPDPQRLGGPGWLERTGGLLTPAQRASMARESARMQFGLLSQRVRRRRPSPVDLSEALTPPDSRLVREAEQAAATQPGWLLGHAYRTSVFARALALVDGVQVDHELLQVCGLLHDTGLIEAVVGEDFTARSAKDAASCAAVAGRPEVSAHLVDAIVVHTTVGVEAGADGALGAYTQFGALADLAGLRERHLPWDLVARAVLEHPREGFARAIVAAVKAEAEAVPGGRFSFLRNVGFGPVVRMAQVPSRP
jgi:hypothetical protein